MATRDFLTNAIQLFVPEPCFTTLLVDFDILNVPCLRVVLSKCLGYAIIVGALLVKLPQIVKIIKAKSGEGINFLSVVLELIAISAGTAYGFAHGFPFSAYGEGLFLVLQTSLIGFLVLMYGGELIKGFAFIGIYTAIMAYLLSPVVSLQLISLLQTSNIAIVGLSKLIQALENYKNGHTGQLSAITVALLFLGSIARIFTSIQETGDTLTILTYVVSTVCNGLIAAQIAYYWNVKIPKNVNRGKKSIDKKKKN